MHEHEDGLVKLVLFLFKTLVLLLPSIRLFRNTLFRLPAGPVPKRAILYEADLRSKISTFTTQHERTKQPHENRLPIEQFLIRCSVLYDWAGMRPLPSIGMGWVDKICFCLAVQTYI